MEVFNKIYNQVSSSVSNTVSQLSGVLPGNPVTREFTATTHTASGGAHLLWKIYKGQKKSTKQEASIFVFEKRQLEKWNRNDRELILDSLKAGVIQLTKIRHPKVLTVQHPLEESRESLAFATEPVFASLGNILGQTTNMPQPGHLTSYNLYEIEVKYGLLQLAEALAFFHNDMKLIHRNICPGSIIINQQGAWKLFAFDFCAHNINAAHAHLPAVYPSVNTGYLPEMCQPPREIMPPEETQISPATDMYALGILIFSLHAKDLTRNLNMAGKLQGIPEGLREYVKALIDVDMTRRPDAHQFLKIPYFDDVGVKTLNYLDSLLQWDNLQKSQFYKGLPEALSKLPQRVKIQRVLSCLSRDLAQPVMIPFVLPSILDIAQECTKEEYCTYVLPHLKPIMKIMDPIQILLLMLQRMELLLKLTPGEDIQQHVLPMLYRGLDSDVTQIHELCLSVLPTFAGLLDHSNVKNSLLPRIKRLCLSTSSLSVRVNCLLCVGRLLEHLDKWLVIDDVLPFLPQIPSREPAVLMGILGIYKLALTHKKLGISKEIIATRILPFLTPLCIENGLSIAQFNALVALVKEMFSQVENEHRTKLEQLNTVKDEQKVLSAQMPSFLGETKATSFNSSFSGLGLESFTETGQKLQPQSIGGNQSNLDSARANIGNNINLHESTMTNLPTAKFQQLGHNIQNPSSSTRAGSGNNNNFFESTLTNLAPTKFQQMGQNVQNPLTATSANTGNFSNTTANLPQVKNEYRSSVNDDRNFRGSITTSTRVTSGYNGQGARNQDSTPPVSDWLNSNPTTDWTSPSWVSATPNLNSNMTSASSKPQNWSVLDSLLPMSSDSQAEKVPMNQMMSHQQPLLPQSRNSAVNNNANYPLSKDDILNFLN